MVKRLKLNIIMIFNRIIITFILSPLMLSCASLGSKILYIDKNVTIEKSTKILLAQPTLVNCIGNVEENYNFLEEVLRQELVSYNISLEKYDGDYHKFDSLGQDTTSIDDNISGAEFLLFTKITRITAMGHTRDYKVEYKLISTLDNKLKFHSKYNTTVGATVVVVPGIKNYPTADQMMAIAISSGLHEFKKNLLPK